MGELREQARQQWLLQQLLDRPAVVPADGWLADADPRLRRGLQAYEANAGASAERALRAAFPTLDALLGAEPLGALARAFWHAQPPVHGDLAMWGEGLAGFIDDSEQLAGWPYLADCARLDWAVARVGRVADLPADPASLALLGEADPSELRLVLAPGTCVLRSAWPVVTLWRAHHEPAAGDPFAEARAALAGQLGEQALVWRQGWRGRVAAVDDGTGRWTEQLLQGRPLDVALDAAGESFAFEPWLVQALRQGWLQSVCRV